MTAKDSTIVSKISVRQLVAGARKAGSLTNPSYSSGRAVDGIKAHKKFTNLMAEQIDEIDLYGEFSLETSFNTEIRGLHYRLEISGRCDLWYLDQDGPCLIEIKSYRGQERNESESGNPLHWAQAETYAHMLLQKVPALHSYSKIRVCLAYVAVDSNDYYLIERVADPTGLEQKFTDLCTNWLQHTVSLIDYRKTRNLVNAAGGFPYDNLREGQRFFMRQAIAAMRDRSTLFAQAATGSGKTMAVVYPALKAQAAGLGSVIFYLTNMSSTKLIAEQAIADLRQNGFLVRSLTLTAKEKICLQPDLYCEMKICPYAQDYYERLPSALQELASLRMADHDTIIEIAQKHRLCPFELQLDFSEWCDIVIGDYNYLFDPRVYLSRFFADDNKDKHIVLIDEAHNLPGRSRQMYSSFLELSVLRQVEQLLSAPDIIDLGPTKLALNRLRQIIGCLDELLPYLREPELQFADQSLLGTIISQQELLRTERFIGTRKLLSGFISNVGSLVYALGQFLDCFPEWESRRTVLELWFELNFFLRVAESYYDKNYITMVRQTAQNDLIIGLLCLDAAKSLTNKYYQRYPIIFFSATLSPAFYYQRLLYSFVTENPPDFLQLASPFAPENRLVLTVDQYSVRYRDRADTLFPILQLIYQAALIKPGHYLVFCPSFAYLRQVAQVLKQINISDQWQIMIQKPKLSEREKSKWLDRFRSTGDKSLLAFACLGSIFSEGIDLTGEQLIGVFIIGTGLPHPSPERELMRQYYEQEFGNGFHFAYTFPGFNRVMQAAGRLIRHEDDRGIIVLIDDRYSREDYQALLPSDWLTQPAHDDEETLALITEFWDS